jgi:hypothetical protein
MSDNMSIQIRGLTLKSRLDFARSKGGEQLMQYLREEPLPVGVIAVAPMISMHSFPLATNNILCRAIAKQLGQDCQIYREMGAFQADAERPMQNLVIGINREPAVIISSFPRHFLHSISGMIGKVRREMIPPNRERIIWEEHQTSYESFCLANIGYYLRVLESAGVIGVSGSNAECVARGEKRCVWEFAWEQVSGLRRATSSFSAINMPSP